MPATQRQIQRQVILSIQTKLDILWQAGSINRTERTHRLRKAIKQIQRLDSAQAS